MIQEKSIGLPSKMTKTVKLLFMCIYEFMKFFIVTAVPLPVMCQAALEYL